MNEHERRRMRPIEEGEPLQSHVGYTADFWTWPKVVQRLGFYSMWVALLYILYKAGAL